MAALSKRLLEEGRLNSIERQVPVTETESGKFSPAYIIGVLLFQQTTGALAFPISKYGLEFIEPFTFAFYRFLISSLVLLLLVSLQKHDRAIAKNDYWKIIGLGFIIIPFNQTLYLWGQSMTAAGHGSLLFATTPIWIFIAAMIHLRERTTIRRAVGIIVAIIGVFIIMTSGAVVLGTEYLWGDLIIIIAVIAWAYYTILGKKLVQKYGAIRVTAYALVSGSVMYFPFGIYRAINFDYTGIPTGAWLTVLYMAIGTSVLTYVLWYWVLKYMEASRIAVYHNIQPLIASGVAFIWLDEPIGWSFVIGGLICLLGVIIAETDAMRQARLAPISK